METPMTQIHNRFIFRLDTVNSIKSGGVKLVLWAQAFNKV